VIDVCPRPPARLKISLRPERVESLTGMSVSAKECARVLTSLGFERCENGDGRALCFVVPSWRGDVSIEEDLVEEVARHHGYDKIKDALPASGIAGEYRKGEGKRRAAKRAMSALGFDEAISFSFIEAASAGVFEPVLSLQVAVNQEDGALVALENPIIEGVTLMRPTLLPGLLGALRHNFNHGTRGVRLFESGRVFAATDSERPLERESLAIVLTGAALEEGRAESPRELDFYDLKGALEAAADAMNVGGLEFEAGSVSQLREGQSARVLLGGNVIGRNRCGLQVSPTDLCCRG
jgi:phenylalanyl-tRNA synthetase beta chain